VHNKTRWDWSIHRVKKDDRLDEKRKRTLLTLNWKPTVVLSVAVVKWSLYKLVRTHFKDTKKFTTYKPVLKPPIPVVALIARGSHGVEKAD
jgi:hypothetical protein